jgi:phosphoglucomutase
VSDTISPLAGQDVPQALLVNIPRLITAYFTQRPDARIAEHKVAF